MRCYTLLALLFAIGPSTRLRAACLWTERAAPTSRGGTHTGSASARGPAVRNAASAAGVCQWHPPGSRHSRARGPPVSGLYESVRLALDLTRAAIHVHPQQRAGVSGPIRVYPVYGWRWVVAPWVYGYGPAPYWGVWGPRYFAWYAHPWFRVGGYWGWGGYRGWGHYGGWSAPALGARTGGQRRRPITARVPERRTLIRPTIDDHRGARAGHLGAFSAATNSAAATATQSPGGASASLSRPAARRM